MHGLRKSVGLEVIKFFPTYFGKCKCSNCSIVQELHFINTFQYGVYYCSVAEQKEEKFSERHSEKFVQTIVVNGVALTLLL